MNNRVLAGARVVVLASQELIRSEVYGVLAIEGWESTAELPEAPEQFIETLDGDLGALVAVVMEESPATCDKFLRALREHGVEHSQVVVGCPSGSLVHRALLRAGCEGFPFSARRTATGLKVDLAGLPTALQNVWHRRANLQLDHEIKEAAESGALALLENASIEHNTGQLKERAHLSCALAHFVSADLNFRERVIRLSLFSDIIFSPRWESIVKESRRLWVIKDLLTVRTQYRSGSLPTALVLPSSCPVELAIVETAVLLQGSRKSQVAFQSQLKTLLSRLSLEKRASLNTAVDACFKRVWSWSYGGSQTSVSG